VPLFDLAKKVKASEKDLSGVPNLTWRDSNGKVISNKTTYCADERMLAELRFANMELQSQG